MFSAQLYKQCSGYYFNHDYLLALNAPQRQRALTFFIATQTPEKLDPEDRNKFEHEWKRANDLVDIQSLCLGILSSALLFRRVRVSVIAAPFMCFSFLQYFQNKVERNFMQGKEVERLCLKYNFTLFDFQESKRSTQLESLIERLSYGVNNPLNSSLY